MRRRKMRVGHHYHRRAVARVQQYRKRIDERTFRLKLLMKILLNKRTFAGHDTKFGTSGSSARLYRAAGQDLVRDGSACVRSRRAKFANLLRAPEWQPCGPTSVCHDSTSSETSRISSFCQVADFRSCFRDSCLDLLVPLWLARKGVSISADDRHCCYVWNVQTAICVMLDGSFLVLDGLGPALDNQSMSTYIAGLSSLLKQ
jgi:hypothetical protein